MTMPEFDITVKNTASAAGDVARIWRACFPSRDAAQDAALFAGVSDARTVFITSDGQTAGMCNLVPLTFGSLRGIYLFAVGVLPGYRGKGGFRLLCETARALAAREGYGFTALVPADTILADTYRRFGYTGQLRIPRYTVPASAKLVRSAMPTPACNGNTVMPSRGFISYIRASYEDLRLGDSFLLCGAAKDGVRPVYEYIPGRAGIIPAPTPAGSYGMILPLSGGIAHRLDGASFYCSMGED